MSRSTMNKMTTMKRTNMKIKIEAAQRLKAFEGDDPNGDHERMEHLRAQISDLVDDVAEIKADGDDASHEEDELARRREEREKLEEKTREGR